MCIRQGDRQWCSVKYVQNRFLPETKPNPTDSPFSFVDVPIEYCLYILKEYSLKDTKHLHTDWHFSVHMSCFALLKTF